MPVQNQKAFQKEKGGRNFLEDYMKTSLKYLKLHGILDLHSPYGLLTLKIDLGVIIPEQITIIHIMRSLLLFKNIYPMVN